MLGSQNCPPTRIQTPPRAARHGEPEALETDGRVREPAAPDGEHAATHDADVADVNGGSRRAGAEAARGRRRVPLD